MAKAPKTTAAFNDLLSELATIRDEYLLGDRWDDELDVVEGFRYVTHLLSEVTELLVDADPERPRFSSIVTPARKFLGDNPDSLYQQALIRGDRAYRVTGRQMEQCYISFTIHGPDPAGSLNGPVQADINDRDLRIAKDGSFELILSPEPKPKGHKGAWIQLKPDARYCIVRNYFDRERSAQVDPDIWIRLWIEPIDDPGSAPALDDATLAQRLGEATAFLRATTTGMARYGGASPAPFVSNEPNTVGRPFSFRNSEMDVAGAVDIFYSLGRYELEPDEALVMEGTIPPCVFANVMLWNVHMQTLDYTSRRSSVNATQLERGPGDSYRIVISERDPGVPNWLDTGGHRHGTIFWRFLLPEEDPEHPRCKVVPVDSLAG